MSGLRLEIHEGSLVTRTLQPGIRISHYHVIGPLGAGGRGEVYLAQDLTLERNVALKVLPPHLVRDDDRLRRFVLEARSASSLNHPNIVTIYEIGQDHPRSGEEVDPGKAGAPPVHFISMELVTGSTLTAKIHQEKADLRSLLGWLAQAAEGLAKAHAAGILHRDLKPGNIMVSKDGFAKVLDFGLAKLTEKQAAGPDLTSAPTETAERTSGGAVLGTAGYMPPEQVQGIPVDLRSDIFSFGCILYEAATRRRPFAAESGVETMHKILREKPPPVEEFCPEAPAELRRLIRRCLAKAPDQRLQSMKDLAIELREIFEEYDSLSVSGTSAGAAATVVHAPPAVRRPAIAAGIAAASLIRIAGTSFGLYALLKGRGSTPEGEASFQSTRITTVTSRGWIAGSTLSGDGRYLAFVSGPPGRMRLWVRQVATGVEAEIVPPQERALLGLAFSPDGDHLFYLSPDPEAPNYRSLMQVSSLGGAPRKRAFDVDSAVSFAPDGRRVCFSRGVSRTMEDTLVILDIESGAERTLATVRRPLQFSAGPTWSPDGKQVAAALWDPEAGARGRVVAYDAGDGSRKPVGSESWGYIDSLVWIPGGGGFVMAAEEMDISSTSQVWTLSYPEGRVRRITNDLNGYWGASVSGDGKAVAALRYSRTSNLWVAPAGGGGRPRPITSDPGSESAIRGFDVTGDGSVVFAASAGGYGRLWTIGVDGAGRRQITSGSSSAFDPRVLPDGGVLFTRIGEERVSHVWRSGPDGGNPRRITEGASASLRAVSPDGRMVVFMRTDAPRDLWAVGVAGGEPKTIAENATGAALFSPDGTRIAYAAPTEVKGLTRTAWKIAPASEGRHRRPSFFPRASPTCGGRPTAGP
jgi:Tol biopolymer transport system component